MSLPFRKEGIGGNKREYKINTYSYTKTHNLFGGKYDVTQ